VKEPSISLRTPLHRKDTNGNRGHTDFLVTLLVRISLWADCLKKGKILAVLDGLVAGLEACLMLLEYVMSLN
jgi:hypothetical protein